MTKRARVVRNTVLWTVAGGVALIGAIVLISAIGETKSGEPMIQNPGTLLGIAITSVGGLMAVILPVMLSMEKESAKTNTATQAIVDQVQNDHKKEDGSPLNLRDDLDGKHREMLERMDLVQTGVQLAIDLSRDNASDIRGMRKDAGRLQDAVKENSKSILLLDKTTSALSRTTSTLGKRIDSLNDTKEEPHE